MIDFRLKVFCCVARHLSFTKSAKQLGVTQPAISNHIQELEQEYAVRLFERHGNHIELTVAGETLLHHAEAILARYEALNFDMQLQAHALSGTLRLGATTTIARYLLPVCLASFAAKFKQIKLSLIEGNSDEITQALEQGCIDIGLIEGANRLAHLRYTPIMRDALVLAAPTAGSWSAIDTVSVDGLKKIPMVMPTAGSDAAQTIESALAREGMDLSQLNVLMQVADNDSIKQFAQRADCLAFVSWQSVKQEVRQGTFKVVDIDSALQLEREFAFVRSVSKTDEVTKDFINYLLRSIKAD